MRTHALYFDDDGKALHPGDFVEVNGNTITMIFEEDGERSLGGWEGHIETLAKVEMDDQI